MISLGHSWERHRPEWQHSADGTKKVERVRFRRLSRLTALYYRSQSNWFGCSMDKELDKGIEDVFIDLDESGDGKLNKEEVWIPPCLSRTHLDPPYALHTAQQRNCLALHQAG